MSPMLVFHQHQLYYHPQDLVAQGVAFDASDYMCPTPAWAVYGAQEAGFDPQETRFRKQRNHKPRDEAAA